MLLNLIGSLFWSNVLFKIIQISFNHITDTRRNITIKILKSVTRNTVHIGVVATVQLRTAQQLQWQQLYTNFLRLSKKYSWNGTRIVSYRLMQIIIYKPTQFCQNMIFANQFAVKSTASTWSQILQKAQRHTFMLDKIVLSVSQPIITRHSNSRAGCSMC